MTETAKPAVETASLVSNGWHHLDVILTSTEAAAELGLTTSGLRTLVERRRLKPITPGARPLTFHAADVYDLQVARRSPADRAWHEALWAAVDQVVAGHATA